MLMHLAIFCANAQTSDLSRVADDVIGVIDEDNDDPNALENLTLLLSSPVNLNSVNAEELRLLNILREDQVREFINYRQQNGPLLSVYELQAIPSFDISVLRLLEKIVRVESNDSRLSSDLWRRLKQSGNGHWINRFDRTLESKAGYHVAGDDQQYQGSPTRWYSRFRSSRPGDFSYGITAEKDPGERMAWRPAKKKFGFDLLTGHLQIVNKGSLANLIVGDFQAQFGQGLIYGGAFGLGKSSESVITTRRPQLGFLPHTSASESGFYRGAAATIQLHAKILLSTLYSRIRRDAKVEINDESSSITSFIYSGLHRNNDELANRASVMEQVAGSVLQYRSANIDGGLIVQHIMFGFPVEKEVNAYNQFAFRGSANTNAGAYLNFTSNNLSFFSEAVRSLHRGFAATAGIVSPVATKLDLAILVRHFDRNYFSFYSNAFSENTQPQNETGFYWGWKYRWNRKLSYSGYMDLFQFPWLASRRYSPAEGFEWLSRVTFQPTRKITLFVQIRQENKPRNTSVDENVYRLADGKKENAWFSFALQESNLRLKTRVQFSRYRMDGAETRGMAIVQSAGFSVGKFQISGQAAVFDCDDFDNRQYVYESDVWLAFSFPAYSGRGVRQVLMLEYNLSKVLGISLRFSRTQNRDSENIGTGVEMTRGNTRNDVKFQTVLKF